MQLYTVVIHNQHIVSRFDAKGNKIGETTTMVEQVIRDMPYATAQMYLRTDTNGTCKITAQERVSGVREHRRHGVKFGDIKTSKSNRAEPTRLEAKEIVRVKPAADPSQKLRNAARTGDMAAAINAGE